jgi:DNA-binding NarL/FixJ family response regulator
MPIRLAIIDDAEVVVRGLTEVLRPHAREVELRALDSRHPIDCDVDLALVDPAFPGPREVALDDLVAHPRVSRVVAFSWNLDRRLVEDALGRGASGYLAKTADARDLVAALHRVHAGERVVHVDLAGAPGRSAAPGYATNGASASHGAPSRDLDRAEAPPSGAGSWPGREAGLTARESEVIALITQGLSNQEIAEQSSLSINSVKSYIRTSYRKMGVSSRTNAVLWGLDHGFSPERGRAAHREDAGS